MARRRGSVLSVEPVTLEEDRDPYLEQLVGELEIPPDRAMSKVVRGQPELYYRVCRQRVHCQTTAAVAKARWQSARERISGQLRRAVHESGRDLIPEDITRQVSAHSDVERARREYVELRARMWAWQALERAYKQRARMLELLGSLRD